MTHISNCVLYHFISLHTCGSHYSVRITKLFGLSCLMNVLDVFYFPFFDILTVLCYICLWSTQQPRKCLNQAVCHGLCLGTASSCISVFIFMFHVQCFGCSLSFFLLSPCVCSFTFVLPDVLGRRGIATRKCSCAGSCHTCRSSAIVSCSWWPRLERPI